MGPSVDDASFKQCSFYAYRLILCLSASEMLRFMLIRDQRMKKNEITFSRNDPLFRGVVCPVRFWSLAKIVNVRDLQSYIFMLKRLFGSDRRWHRDDVGDPKSLPTSCAYVRSIFLSSLRIIEMHHHDAFQLLYY
jgi:hypothetical protein